MIQIITRLSNNAVLRARKKLRIHTPELLRKSSPRKDIKEPPQLETITTTGNT
jgi:hypothetical protein